MGEHEMTTRPTDAFIIIADGEFDQVCDNRSDAAIVRRELRGMGCTVRVVRCAWDEQDEVMDGLFS